MSFTHGKTTCGRGAQRPTGSEDSEGLWAAGVLRNVRRGNTETGQDWLGGEDSPSGRQVHFPGSGEPAELEAETGA